MERLTEHIFVVGLFLGKWNFLRTSVANYNWMIQWQASKLGHFFWLGPARSGPSIPQARPAQSLFYSARPGPSWPDSGYKCLFNKNIHGIELNDHLHSVSEPGKE
jgi:hypothetical protein